MIAAIASAALIVAGSLVVGQAVLRALRPARVDRGSRARSASRCCSSLAGIVAGLGGGGTAIAIVARRRCCSRPAVVRPVAAACRGVRPPTVAPALAARAALAALFAALPFIAAGHVGILGVGLVNDDMASHLLLADWIDERFRPEPVLIDQGYPLGPHALVAGLGDAARTRARSTSSPGSRWRSRR